MSHVKYLQSCSRSFGRDWRRFWGKPILSHGSDIVSSPLREDVRAGHGSGGAVGAGGLAVAGGGGYLACGTHGAEGGTDGGGHFSGLFFGEDVGHDFFVVLAGGGVGGGGVLGFGDFFAGGVDQGFELLALGFGEVDRAETLHDGAIEFVGFPGDALVGGEFGVEFSGRVGEVAGWTLAAILRGL